MVVRPVDEGGQSLIGLAYVRARTRKRFRSASKQALPHAVSPLLLRKLSREKKGTTVIVQAKTQIRSRYNR